MEKDAEYRVRNYKSGDDVHLARIYSECFGPVTPRVLKQWHRRTGVLPEDIFIGEVDGKLVSCVEIVLKDLHMGEGVYLRTAGVSGVCTDSDYRRKGIVTKLLKLNLNHAKETGASNASLYTGLDIPAHRIYNRLGFMDVATNRLFIKYLDFPFVFGRWIRYLNRSVKASKIAQKKLVGWEKTVALQIEDVGTLAFRFRKGRFQRLKKAPRTVDIDFSTDIETYHKIRMNVIEWKKAVETGKLVVRRGEPSDIEMLNRILKWMWE